MEIQQIIPKDYLILQNIGAESLKIYYDYYDIQHMNNFSNNIMLKGILNNEIIGFIFCTEKEDNIHVNSFAIVKEFRNKGYGTQLINHIKTYGKSLTLNTEQDNHEAIKFYRKNMFEIKELRNNYYENFQNNNAYFMKYNFINLT